MIVTNLTKKQREMKQLQKPFGSTLALAPRSKLLLLRYHPGINLKFKTRKQLLVWFSINFSILCLKGSWREVFSGFAQDYYNQNTRITMIFSSLFHVFIFLKTKFSCFVSITCTSLTWKLTSYLNLIRNYNNGPFLLKKSFSKC